MAKTKISEFNANPALNTDIDSINIAEGCAPSGINDAIRELMSQLKDWQSGTSNDPYVVGSSGSLTLNQGTANGVAYLNGSKVVTSGSALTFDGSKLGVGTTPAATIHGYVADGGYVLGLSGTTKGLRVSTDSSQTLIQGVDSTLIGSYQPLTLGGSILVFQANGTTEAMRLTSTGLGIGTSSPSTKLTIGNGGTGGIASGALGVFLSRGSTTNFYEAFDGTKAFIAGSDDAQSYTKVGSLSNHPVRLVADNGTGYIHLTTAGNLGLGVTPSASTLPTIQSTYGVLSGNTNVSILRNAYYNSGWKYTATGAATFYQHDGGSHIWYNAPSGTAGNAITFTQAMTLDASGVLLVGTTSGSGASRFVVKGSGASSRLSKFLGDTTGDLSNASVLFSKYDNNSTTSQVFLQFSVNNDTTANGQINANGASQVAFGSWSDARLKENIVDLTPQLPNIMALRPVEFDYIESEGGGHQTGFIAQEMETVFPDAVGERSDGMKTVTGWGKTEAILVKAIQELKTEFDAYKATHP